MIGVERNVCALDQDGAILDCGHRTAVDYGERSAWCYACVRETRDQIRSVRARAAARCQQAMAEEVWNTIWVRDRRVVLVSEIIHAVVERVDPQIF